MKLEKVVGILQICERWRRKLCSVRVVADNACVLGMLSIFSLKPKSKPHSLRSLRQTFLQIPKTHRRLKGRHHAHAETRSRELGPAAVGGEIRGSEHWHLRVMVVRDEVHHHAEALCSLLDDMKDLEIYLTGDIAKNEFGDDEGFREHYGFEKEKKNKV
ncbi:hypothetical protein VNO80_15314 [Phaseolus coccineus]|uniref:Uncharacterized protein n=1 Tax=Phaseolus coccineus TaxID=3886 RepID=A0AAN9MR81_PHACN